MRKSFIFVVLVLLGAQISAAAEEPKTTRVLATVGGVSYSTSIIRVLESIPSINLTIQSADSTPVMFTQERLENIDVVLMYHRDNVAEPQEREALMQFVDNGGGVIVLHHSIANYPEWPNWWRNHVGGLYVLPGHGDLKPSRYFYDFRGVARAVSDHPVTDRLGGIWRIDDESYSNLWVSDKITPLLQTTAFGSQTDVAWIGPSKKGRVLFIQPGHFDTGITSDGFRLLIEDALLWASQENE